MRIQAWLVLLVATLLIGSAVHADELARYFGAGGGLSMLIGGSALSTSNPFPVTSSGVAGVSQANVSSICASVPNTSTTVTLTTASSTIDVYTSSDAATVHVNWANGTATTGNAAIYAGGTYRYQGTPITSFTVIGESATGHYNVVAK